MLTPRSTLDAPHRRGTRRVAVADSSARRRMRQRPHDAAAAAARSTRPRPRRSRSTSSAPRRRPSVFCARWPRRRRFRSASAARRRPRRLRRDARRFSPRAAPAAASRSTFLLDEFLELRTFESFPGLRRVLHDFIDCLASSGNRFVLTSRYVGANAAAAARRIGSLRSHPHAAA